MVTAQGHELLSPEARSESNQSMHTHFQECVGNEVARMRGTKLRTWFCGYSSRIPLSGEISWPLRRN